MRCDFLWSKFLQLVEVTTQLFDRIVKRDDAAVGARLHHAALHYCEDELSELVKISAVGKTIRRIAETLPHGRGPAIEVGGDLLVNLAARRVDFEREASDRAREGEVRDDDLLPVAVEQGENALDRIRAGGVSRAHDNRLQIRQVPVEDGVQQVFLAFKEKVETAAVGLRFPQNLSHARGFVSLRVKKLNRGEDDPIAGCGSRTHHD